MSADVSVVIPFYRGAATIARAVRSVERQALPPREIIVVDDGSPEPLPALQSTVPVRVPRHDTNRGIPSARNTGIRAAQGAWIGFLDQDDEWAEDKLARQWRVANAAAADPPVVFGRLLHSGGGRTPWIWPPLDAVAPLEAGGERALEALVRWGNAAPFVTLLVARRTWDRHGLLDESIRGGSDDWEYLLRIVAEGATLRFDSPPAGGWSAVHHFTGENYSAHAPRILDGDLRIVERLAERYPLILQQRDRLTARTHYTYGRYHDRAGNRREARRHYETAARLDPAWRAPRLARLWLVLPQRLRDEGSRLRDWLRGWRG